MADAQQPKPKPKPAKPGIVDLRGTTLNDRYQILRVLGAGGMGAVYLAEHTTLRKKVAIKVLTRNADRPELVERFLREARATSIIEQQNVIEISDFGETPDGSIYFVMEYLEGEDLRALIKRERPLPWARVRHLAVQICRALEAAHAAGIVHRDMKPDNCYRVSRASDPDFVKVLDFGIAKILDGPETKGLTKTGMIIGTAEYMAPEQARGELDPRSDIYAVGVIMYEMLCGRVPFKDKSYVKVLTKHMFNAPTPPSQRAPDAQIPPDAEAVVLKAMQKDPALRFANMAEMIGAIEAVGTGAAAVAVIQENIVRPDTSGSMAFVGQSPAASSAGAPVAVAGADDSPGLPPALWIGVVGLGLAALLGVFAALGLFDDGADEAAPDEEAAPALAAAPEQPAAIGARAEAPAPVEAPAKAEAPAPTLAHLSFETNVPAEILAGEDRSLLGRTDGEAVEIPLSDQPLALILVAEGHEELAVEVVPSVESKMFSYELQRVGAPRTKKKKTKAQDAPKLPSAGGDSEVKNPFAKP